MKSNRPTIADYELLKLYPRDRWKVAGTFSNAVKTTPETYRTQFNEWLKAVHEEVLMTNAPLQWFARIEKDGGRWHLHFVLGDNALSRETGNVGGITLLAARIRKLWPVPCNSDVYPYMLEHPKGGRWESYICKAGDEDRLETHAYWSRSLKKEIMRIQRQTENQT